MRLQEAEILEKFRLSKHVVQILEFDDRSDVNLPPVIFMEFISGTTLYEHRKGLKKVSEIIMLSDFMDLNASSNFT
jgi:hypothetical protein